MFISTYYPIPLYNEESKEPEYWIETYFPSYTGIVTINQYEKRIISKLNFIYRQNLNEF